MDINIEQLVEEKPDSKITKKQVNGSEIGFKASLSLKKRIR
ncbi:hypothetical protein [Rossellomorea vietnamensis]|nr:hypothetical protein [Rossellomorea vietnamensis]